MSKNKKMPLEGIRVIDMSIVWALPWTGAMLGEMGAEVIRMESLQYAPRIVRHGGLPRPANEFLPFLGTFAVTKPAGPCISLMNASYNDDDVAPSSGNG